MLHSDIENSREVCELLFKLTQTEGDSVRLHYVNPEFGDSPDCVVTIVREFGSEFDYYADSVLECLKLAYESVFLPDGTRATFAACEIGQNLDVGALRSGEAGWKLLDSAIWHTDGGYREFLLHLRNAMQKSTAETVGSDVLQYVASVIQTGRYGPIIDAMQRVSAEQYRHCLRDLFRDESQQWYAVGFQSPADGSKRLIAELSFPESSTQEEIVKFMREHLQQNMHACPAGWNGYIENVPKQPGPVCGIITDQVTL